MAGGMRLFLPLAAGFSADVPDVPAWWSAPFLLLLALIAVMPLTPPRLKHFWERYHPHLTIGLGLLVAVVYLARFAGGEALVGRALREYGSFICLLGSLYVVAGGIHLTVKGEATPLENVGFLAAGALVANVVGTIGASIVLIRPWIRMNKIRISGHHIVFFIFLVSNCGGMLTPVGNPPLFLGFLRGVPFFWLAAHLWAPWLFTVAAVLAVFYLLDRRSFRRAPAAIQAQIEAPDTFRVAGGVNVVFLLVIVGAMFLPSVWGLRELTMAGAAAASYWLTPRTVHADNRFRFGPLGELAVLFFGIFLTMTPALNYLDRHGREFGALPPAGYYFASGGLSAVLDNAPTYLNFLELAEATLSTSSTPKAADRAEMRRMLVGAAMERIVIAISLGSVFFGGMTYIGNGPNFMVKAIAEDAGVKVPSFFGYLLKYSLPFLLPILVLVGWLFL